MNDKPKKKQPVKKFVYLDRYETFESKVKGCLYDMEVKFDQKNKKLNRLALIAISLAGLGVIIAICK